MNKYNLIFALISFLIFSCNKEDQELSILKVNHYQQTSSGWGPSLINLVQEGDDIDTENWSGMHLNVEGFDYELGYIYELIVIKEHIKNPPADGSSIKYTLHKIASKEKIGNTVPFEIRLKWDFLPMTFITGTIDSGFKISETTAIDCHILCSELSNLVETSNSFTGIFNHTDTGNIKLIELKDE